MRILTSLALVALGLQSDPVGPARLPDANSASAFSLPASLHPQDDQAIEVMVVGATGEPVSRPVAMLLDSKGGILHPTPSSPLEVRHAEGADGRVVVARLSGARYLAVRDLEHRTVIVPLPEDGSRMEVVLDQLEPNALLTWPDTVELFGPLDGQATSDTIGAVQATLEVMHWDFWLPFIGANEPGVLYAPSMAYRVGEANEDAAKLLAHRFAERSVDEHAHAKLVLAADWMEGLVMGALDLDTKTWFATTLTGADQEIVASGLAPVPLAQLEGETLVISDRQDVLAAATAAGAEALDLGACRAALFTRNEAREPVCLGSAQSAPIAELGKARTQAETAVLQLQATADGLLRDITSVHVAHDDGAWVEVPVSASGRYAVHSSCGADHTMRVRRGAAAQDVQVSAGAPPEVLELEPMGVLTVEVPGEWWPAWYYTREGSRRAVHDLDLKLRERMVELPAGSYQLLAFEMNGYPGFADRSKPVAFEIRPGEVTKVRFDLD